MAYILITYKNNKFNFKFNINIDHKKEIIEEIVEIINHTIYEEIPLPFIGNEYCYYDDPIIITNKIKNTSNIKTIYLEKIGDSIGQPSKIDKIFIKIDSYSNKKILIKWYNNHLMQIAVYRKNLIENIDNLDNLNEENQEYNLNDYNYYNY